MDSLRTKQWMRMAALVVALLGLVMGGCRLVTLRNGWNKKKWGPLVPHENFPGDCGICHLPDRWDKLRDDFSFDHKAETGYPLVGAHAQAVCLRCHNDRGPVQAYVSRGCAGCHLDPHAATFGLDCERCHSQFSWEPTGLVAEHAATRFPLTGVHVVASCESCHEGAAAGRFTGAPTQCEICHQDDLAGAVNPDHAAAGWTSSCQDCHLPSSWTGAFIGHEFFPLVGGHAGHDCFRCHAGGVYTGLSPECYSCHSAEYQAAPNHVADGYSQDCSLCHTVYGWIPASFHHPYFPLSGPHNVSCNECHTTGSPPAFSCIDCHEHRQSEADSEHSGMSGYSYNSQACYSCHPSGRD
ncbi:MAG: hypothetical protein ABFR33_01830 [Verrucomicrobiota bacterium]